MINPHLDKTRRGIRDVDRVANADTLHDQRGRLSADIAGPGKRRSPGAGRYDRGVKSVIRIPKVFAVRVENLSRIRRDEGEASYPGGTAATADFDDAGASLMMVSAGIPVTQRAGIGSVER